MSWKTGLVATALVAIPLYAAAQMMPRHGNMSDHMSSGSLLDHQGMSGAMHGMMQQMHGQMMQGQGGAAGPMGQHGMMHQQAAGSQPTLPGQDAFGAIQEVVRILDSDPTTDWTKVSVGALREHLIDMNEVTLHAKADERTLDNGLEVTVTGEGRTLEAVKRMIPAHIRELDKLNDWAARSEEFPDGVKFTVTSADPKQVPKIKALGFMGIMVQGSHHQTHHLMMAKGEFHDH